MKLSDPLTRLPGVGPKLGGALAGLGLTRCEDLLFHLPRGYEDRTRVWPIGALIPGLKKQIAGRVERADVKFGKRRSLVVSITDGEARIALRFFTFHKGQVAQFAPGQWLRCFGTARPGHRGLEIVHPEYALADGQAAAEQDVANALTPEYPATAGVTGLRLRKLIERVIGEALDQLKDPLPMPPFVTNPQGQPVMLPSLRAAIALAHSPPPDTDLNALADGSHPAVQRLAFDELLAHHLSLTQLRARLRSDSSAPALTPAPAGLAALFGELGFEPTGAQQRVIDEIVHDLAQPRPMMRLVQGDVGSGKTVVAAAALVTAAASGGQAALMAPTELLAEQHASTLGRWLEPLGIDVVLLSGRLPKKRRDAAIERLATGQPCVAIGTHALFQASVEMPGLVLAVVDEQHRFGVHQRLALLDKGGSATRSPHQLIMTATPIPRTLAMRAYAHLDTSVIDALPPGRTPVETVAIDRSRRDDVIARVRHACGQGRQAYWVCTLVEASEQLDADAAEDTADTLKTACPDLRIGLVHGRLKPADKAAVMAAFKAGETDVLVATTVIEVGVDVPNASVMVIDNAERLGLAQLHQLRGRVGRGSTQSYCVLMFDRGSKGLSGSAQARINVMRQSNDGFVIAEQDLALRGPGEVLGTRQTGDVGMKIADLVRDADLVDAVAAYAAELGPARSTVAKVLEKRWLSGGLEYVRA